MVYKDFLQLSSGSVEEGEEVKSASQEELADGEGEGMKDGEDDQIDKEEFREELTMIMNETETSYQDLKYWKRENNFDIETLMHELEN